MNLKFFYSPLEQFEVLPLIPLYFGGIDVSITNETVILLIIFFFISILFFSSFNPKDSTLNLIPSKFQSVFEFLYRVIISLVVDNLGKESGQPFFPILFSIFFFIVCLNLIGLIPYSFTLTSHLIVTFALALFIFIALNIICVKKHGFAFFSLFLPSGTSFGLALLLVPIEFISYVFKPVSLSIRLFANMMAGHTLLKVIAGFAYTMMGLSGVLFFVHYVPLLILIPLFLLELGVSLIQAFVFSVLICIYLNDAINLH
jgi:F0F1-type ATP synthase membrane subunit a